MSFPLRIKFGLVNLHIMSLISEKFREYWCKEIHILFKGMKEIFPLPASFLSDFGEIRYFIYICNSLFSDFELRENYRSEIHTYFGLKEILSCIPSFSFSFR
jgi:hypothetical protein